MDRQQRWQCAIFVCYEENFVINEIHLGGMRLTCISLNKLLSLWCELSTYPTYLVNSKNQINTNIITCWQRPSTVSLSELFLADSDRSSLFYTANTKRPSKRPYDVWFCKPILNRGVLINLQIFNRNCELCIKSLQHLSA